MSFLSERCNRLRNRLMKDIGNSFKRVRDEHDSKLYTATHVAITQKCDVRYQVCSPTGQEGGGRARQAEREVEERTSAISRRERTSQNQPGAAGELRLRSEWHAGRL